MSISTTAFASRRRLRLGRFSAVWRAQVVLVNLLLIAALIVLCATSITIGDYPISFGTVFEVFFGGGTRLQRTVVLDWRMQRALAAIVVGLALGLAGALTQSVTRNPLASPDILGISEGASACAVTVIVLGGLHSSSAITLLSSLGIPAAALLGSLVTAVVIWFLGTRRGMDTFRLVLAGIMITALLQAYITWLLLRASITDATIAKTWLTGSLATSSLERNLPVILVVGAILPLIGYVSFTLRAVLLGDHTAAGLGVNVGRSHTLFLLLAVLLTAFAVAAAGPIGFVAFVAPHIAMRLMATSSPPLLGSALCGAVLLSAADLATRTLLPAELPVGLITSAIGGMFLVYLLVKTNRKNTL